MYSVSLYFINKSFYSYELIYLWGCLPMKCIDGIKVNTQLKLSLLLQSMIRILEQHYNLKIATNKLFHPTWAISLDMDVAHFKVNQFISMALCHRLRTKTDTKSINNRQPNFPIFLIDIFMCLNFVNFFRFCLAYDTEM